MLKALELAGFKSFADRTRFEFPAGITVVVGPNGSGKSNVVDAIKWVLGEQSARSLRGGEMSDVIFQGSDASGRKPANTAEATLIFDNRDQRLEIDADEVHVTRRVYRSGEGEYLINKRPCRLRDIRDVFRGTGMGTDAYSLIEQGKVDTLLQASPRDRRAIFEEAAGISRFKAKKVEAQRRLERVEQNLLRLSDIVEELDGRLRSLRAQATKARRYQEYTERLQQLRLQVGLADYRNFATQFDTASEQLANGRRLLASVAAQTEALEARRLELDTEKEMSDEVLRAAESRVATHRHHIALGNARVHAQLQRCQELQDEKLRSGKRYLGFQQTVGTAGKQLELARNELTAAQQQLHTLQARVEVERTQLDSASRHVADLQTRMDGLRESQHAIRRAMADLESQVAYWQLRLQELSPQLEQLVQREQEANAQWQLCTTFEEAALESLRHATAAEADARQAWTDAQRQLEQLDAQIAQVHDRWADRRRILEGLRERAAVLEELEQLQEGLHAGTRELLKRANAPEASYPEIQGMVADLLRVDVEMAHLVDMALGERSQFLLVTGDRLFADLARGLLDPGRVGLIAAESLVADIPSGTASEPLPPLRQDLPGILGPATQFVETDPEFTRLIPFLLDNCWFAETLADARQLVALRPSLRVVTRDGHICEPGGVMAYGGYRERYQIVSRRSELRKLRSDIERASSEYELDDQRLTAYRNEREAFHQQLALASQAMEAARLALQQTAWDRQQSQQNCAAASARRDACQLELAQLQQQIEQAHATHRDATHDLAQLQDQATTAGQTLEQLETDHRLLATQRDSDAQQVAELAVEMARWQQTVTHRQEHVVRWEREQSERDALEFDLREQAARRTVAHEQMERALLQQGMELAELYLQIDHEEYQIVAARQAVSNLAAERRTLSQQLSELRREKQRWDESTQRDQLDVERLRQLRDTLVARFREDLEIDLAQHDQEGAPPLESDRTEADQEIAELRRKISNIGAVNLESLQDLQALESRYEDLAGQFHDLQSAKDALQRIIQKINTDSKRLFSETLEKIRSNFQLMFRKVFGGGEADIVMDQSDEDVLERGIEIVATPPGKQSLRLSLLSGGERALTAVTLLLAIFQYRPSPFCVLDEVDGPLDEANIGRFINVLHEFLAETKFVIVTHSKVTMTAASTLYGITMQESGVSKQVSVRFEDVSEGGEIHPAALQRANTDDAA